MAVGKGSIQRATRTLKEENTEKVAFTEPKEAEAKAPAKRGRKPGTAGKTAAAKKAATGQGNATVKKTAGRKSYQQVSHIKSELPIHLL